MIRALSRFLQSLFAADPIQGVVTQRAHAYRMAQAADDRGDTRSLHYWREELKRLTTLQMAMEVRR